MKTVTANDLKRNGVSLLEKAMEDGEEAIISVRGKNRFVVMNLDTYDSLREYELDAALRESMSDLKTGQTVEESVDDHISRLMK